jgi:predicted ATPase/DNA-binding CsgD family transcriptional regulator
MTAEGAARISRREAEVLEAVGEHLTNAEIAERLYISVRTVESHVSTLLRKLDVEDRRALARVAAERAAADAPRNDLPFTLTSFIGRETERAAVLEAMTEGRLVTITGTGGVGKTRLSLEVGRRLVDSGAPRLWFVDLARVAEGSGVVVALLATVGVRTEPGRSPLEALVAELDRGGTVVVLDNCEHLIDAVAELTTTLLARTRELRLLLTSREALGMAGERIVPIAPFEVPSDAADAVEALVANDGVRLFVDRARAVDPRFVLDATTAAPVAAIVRHLDGLPLALELAAVQVVALSPSQIDARLRDRFVLLGGRTGDPRHGTLETMLEWSYQLLGDEERAVLDRLAVFRGSFTLDAIEAVVVDDRVAASAVGRIVTALVRKSLVTVDDRGTERRYGLLETVREFAWRRLEEADAVSTWRDRHMDWAFDLASRAGQGLHGRDQPVWLDRLDDDLDNIEAALAWSLGDPDRADRALLVVLGLYSYWLARGTHRSQGMHWSRAVAAAATNTDVSRRTRSLLSSMSLLIWSDLDACTNLVEAIRELEDDDPIARIHGDTAEAWLAGFRGDPRPSLVARAEAVGVDARMVRWMRGFDVLHHAMREPRAESHRRMTDLSQEWREAGDEHLYSGFLGFAVDYAAESSPEIALADAREALEIARDQFGCPSCESGALVSLSLVDECSDQGGRIAAARRALSLADSIAERVSVYAALDVLAGALAEAGAFEEAAVVGLAVASARAQSGHAQILPGREGSRQAALEAARAGLGPERLAELEAEAAALSYRDLVALGLG